MAIRITSDQLFNVEGGKQLHKIEGYCNAADKDNLPTEDIINGSYMVIVDEPNTVTFFDEETSAWG